MNNIIIPSNHFQEEYKKKYWNENIVGTKAVSLNSVPSSWTPPFIVISINSQRIWRRNKKTKKDVEEIDKKVLKKYLKYFTTHFSNLLIIRSSAPFENLEERGLFESKPCNANIESVIETINYLWERMEQMKNKNKDNHDLALIIQPYIRTVSAGHLSNERRVCKNYTDWICEFEVVNKQTIDNIFKFSVKNVKVKNEDYNLICKSKKQLQQKIKLIASITTNQNIRCHFEWIWDSNKLWLVQRDIEIEYQSNPPMSNFIQKITDNESISLSILKDTNTITKNWPKIQCLQIFKKCNLPIANVYILEDKKILSDLIKNKVDADLRHDLNELMKIPIVIRTDIINDDEKLPFLLPSTNAISNIKDVKDFLCITAEKLYNNGFKPDQFCFIFHRFIKSNASAFCYSQPNIPRMLIDSSWGLPDGLSFYPHDSFEVNIENENNIKRKIRCKYEFLGIDEQGNFIKRRCGAPWDWKSSLKKNELIKLAQYSKKVAEYIKKPVQIMFFVDVDPSSGLPSLIPWYSTSELPDYTSKNINIKTRTSKVIITNAEELSDYQRNIKDGFFPKNNAILLKPGPDLLRSKDFLKKITEIAVENDAPIELEGSILSHSYYILQRNGVKIKCHDPFEPSLKSQTFSKLVRDLIPVHIKTHGESAQFYRLTQEELLPLLKAKLIEEALELFWETNHSNELEELADIYEVIMSICKVTGKPLSEIKKISDNKRTERGGFGKGIVLIQTQELPLIKKEKINQLKLTNKGGVSDKIDGFIGYNKIIRKPLKKSGKIILPLIPPNIEDHISEIKIELEEFNNDLIVNYGEKEIYLIFQDSTKSVSKFKQSKLIPIEEVDNETKVQKSAT